MHQGVLYIQYITVPIMRWKYSIVHVCSYKELSVSVCLLINGSN